MATIQKRVSSDKKVCFRVRVRIKGFPIQTASFSRLTDAKKWAQQIESDIHQGRYFKIAEVKKHTLAEAIDRYIADIIPTKSTKPKSRNDQSTQLLWWKKAIGHEVLSNITPAIIIAERDKIAKVKTVTGSKRTPATVNRYMAALSHLFTIAVKEWGWVTEHPVKNVSKLKEPRGRVRFLTEPETQRLLASCKDSKQPYLFVIVILCLSTGARQQEIVGLKWSDIDFERGMIILHDTKNNERRSIPLVGHAMDVFKQHQRVRRLKSDYVFPSKISLKPIEIRSAWVYALARANIEDFRFHDLRHTAASYLAMSAASLAEISDVLGHKSLAMVKRYAHLSDSHTANIVSKMNKKLFGT